MSAEPSNTITSDGMKPAASEAQSNNASREPADPLQTHQPAASMPCPELEASETRTTAWQKVTSSFGVRDLDASEEETRYAEIMRDQGDAYAPPFSHMQHRQQGNNNTMQQQPKGSNYDGCPDVALFHSGSSVNEAITLPGGNMNWERPSLKYRSFSWISSEDCDDAGDYDKENQCLFRENVGSHSENQRGLIIRSDSGFGLIYPSPAFSEDEMQQNTGSNS